MIHPLSAGIIDIGSNSIRYLHAVFEDEKLSFSQKQLTTTRLAEGLDKSGCLSEASMQRSILALENFANISRENNADYLFIYATSAVRDAKNGGLFCEAVKKRVGLDVDVLSCQREAFYAYKGAVGTKGGGFVELGGGSAQLVNEAAALSFPIGCIRARDEFSACGLLELGEQLACWVRKHVISADCFFNEARWTGAGGTITTLAALFTGLSHYDSAVVNSINLTRADLQALLKELVLMGEERRHHPLLKERHDIIIYAAYILLELMRIFRINTLAASDADGMEGYIIEKLLKL